jgi:glutathione synthase/RimK-type ligase-like ATP-grasp enzyme
MKATTDVGVYQREEKCWNFWPTVALFLMTFLMVSCEENPYCDKPFDFILITDDISINETWAINEDHPLMENLQALGHMVGRKSFTDLEFDWSLTKVVVLKSTENRFDRNLHLRKEWLQFLEDVRGKTRMIPSHETINWLKDKASYTKDLQGAGINVLPFVLVKGQKEGEVANESNNRLRQIKDEHGWETLVFKPNTANKGRWIEKVTNSDFDKRDKQFQYLLSHGHDMLVQEFQRSISEQGEVSVVIIGNNVTHAVLKKPKPGGILVHEHWGGTTKLHVPTQEEIAFARNVVREIGKPLGHFLLRARIDMIRDNSNELALMELSATSPHLHLAKNPEAAKIFAEHLHHELCTICSCEDSRRTEL